MKKRIGHMWLVPVLFALLLSSAAGARTITTVEGLLELCGTTVNEDITLSGVFDLTGLDWTPIKRVAEGVTIEGNGATIIGMDMSATGDWEGGLDQTGFVGGNKGTISGLKFVLNSSASSRAWYNGVVAAVNEYQATITDCTVCGDPNGSEVVLTNTLFNANLGGICGHNVGYVVRCLVSDLTLTDTNGACIGSIAGNNHYYIDSCFADSMKLIGGSVDTKIGGIVGQSIGNVESSFAAHTDFNTVTSTSISGKGLFMGGLVGNARYVDVISNRVNYVDICHEDSEGNSCYLGGILGGLVDLVEGYTSLVSSNYYADNCSAGMSWEDGDYAGGIVGGYQAADSRTVFMRCYYCTDFCSAPMAGINDGYDYPETFDICDGVSKAVMTGEGWAEDNLLSPWKNTGPDNYPVIDDRIPVSFSRVHRGKEYVSLRSARLLWNGKDVSALGLTGADTEFDPADFTLSCADGLPLEIDYVTVNGRRFTQPVTAGDYERLSFSAVVDNSASRDILQPCVDKGNELYEAGMGIYSPATLILLKEALDEAEDALSTGYLAMTVARALELAEAIEDVELDHFAYTVDLVGDNAFTYVNDSAEESFTAFSGDTVRLNAIPHRGYKFVCWKDSAGNVISDTEEFEYTVSRTTALEAVAAPAESYMFIYKDMYGKVYKRDAVTDFFQVSYPAEAGDTGLRTGYRVREWTNNYRGELPDSGEVTQDVTFTAILEKADTRYTVQAFAGDDVTVKLLKAAQVFRVTAPDTYNDDDFSYWTDTDTGEIVSYSLNLSVSVYANMSFTAVYGGGVDDVTLVNLWTPNVESGKIGFTAQVLTGLDFASEVMHGVLLLESDESVDEILFDTPGVIVGRSSGYSAVTNTFIINKKNVRSGDTWYGRAFVVYTDDGGNRKTVYSDIKSATMP